MTRCFALTIMCAPAAPPDQAFTPDVLEELYGSHGIEFAPNHYRPVRRGS